MKYGLQFIPNFSLGFMQILEDFSKIFKFLVLGFGIFLVLLTIYTQYSPTAFWFRIRGYVTAQIAMKVRR